jgi:uncharacterized membrane protein YhaH (DUF805 family)
MTFDQSIRSVVSKYATFQGRAGRSEFWYWVLFTVLVSIGINILDSATGAPGVAQLGLVFSLGTFVPSIAVDVRRLHDVGKSGWNLLWILTIIGGLYLLYLYVQPSQPGANEYGTTATAP